MCLVHCDKEASNPEALEGLRFTVSRSKLALPELQHTSLFLPYHSIPRRKLWELNNGIWRKNEIVKVAIDQFHAQLLRFFKQCYSDFLKPLVMFMIFSADLRSVHRLVPTVVTIGMWKKSRGRY